MLLKPKMFAVAGAGIGVLSIFLILLMPMPSHADPIRSDLKIVRKRVVSDLLSAAPSQSAIEALAGSIREDGSWSAINYEDVSRTGFEHRQHLANILKLARAFRHPDSEFYHDETVKEPLESALDFWLHHDFISDNWFHNQITVPKNMIRILLIMDQELNADRRELSLKIAGRANFDAWGARPGADMVRIGAIVCKRGLFRNDPDMLSAALDAMLGEIHITTGKGIQHDFSFHHREDGVISTNAYGKSHIDGIAFWAGYVNGTGFEFPRDRMQLVVDFYLDGVVRHHPHGKYRDPGGLNRGIARRSSLSPRSRRLPERLLQATSYRASELQDLVRIREGEMEPRYRHSTFFWRSEYMTHQRPAYFTSVRMYSERNNNIEQPYNREGLKNHHLADGSSFLTMTGMEYKDIWPAFDWQKVPGSTIVQKPHLPGTEHMVKSGLTDFVGALSNGAYGLAVLDFESPHDSLTARKAWFFFDNEYVCLGSGIHSDSGFPVATTLNQCLLNGNVFAGSESRHIVEKGDHILNEIRWVHHDGVSYLFPSPQTVRLTNRTAEGNWRDINEHYEEGYAEKDVFKLWIDHGTAPVGAEYGYIVLPGTDTEEAERYLQNPEVEILANTERMQAVKHAPLGICQIAFYEPAAIALNEELRVETDSRALVMLTFDDDRPAAISAADPTRKKNHIRLTLTSEIEGSGPGWEAEWDPKAEHSVIHFDFPDGEHDARTVHLVVDQDKLARTALGDESFHRRLHAVKSLADRDALTASVLSDSKWQVRRAAINVLDCEDTLAEAAISDTNALVRMAAVERTEDRNVLAEAAKNDADPHVRVAAIRKLPAGPLLNSLALGDKCREVRHASAEKITDQKTIASVLDNEKCSHIRQAVVGRISNQNLLAKTSVKDDNREVRYAAFRRLEDRDIRAQTAIQKHGFRIPKIDRVLSIDGDLSDWEGLPHRHIESEDPKKNLKAKIYTGWDEDYLYIAVRVRDDQHFNKNENTSIWDGDSFQFAIDPLDEDIHPFNAALALASGRIRLQQYMGEEYNLTESSEYAVVRDKTEGITSYEIKIPLKNLLIPEAGGSVIGFNAVIFDDTDGEGHDYWIELAPGLAGGWDPSAFNLFLLCEESVY